MLRLDISPVVEQKKDQQDEPVTTSTPHISKYTVFNTVEKYSLVLLSSSIAIWSAFGSPIYYPALQILESYFDITEELVNVSVVVYMACQAISPVVFAPFADRYGRRPVLIVCLLIFIGASIGLAVANSYPLILVLRCIQSFGISPAVAIACGITGDWTEREERGWFVGLTNGFTNFGQAIGSLIGAGLIAGFDWRAIFWFLAIGSGTILVLMLCCLPETKRSIVGNGSIVPKHFIGKAPILLMPYYKRKWDIDDPDYSTLAPEKKTDFTASLRILKRPELAICLFNAAVHYALWTVQLTSLTTELSKLYDYSVIKIGLCYLPAGVGGLLGSFFSGRIMDWFYQKSLTEFQRKKATGLIESNQKLNIVKTRVMVAVPFTIMTDGFTVMYGWCLGKDINIATVLISEFFISNGCMALLSIITTLLIDLYPSNSSAATSCVNLTRCLMGAVFVAALASMNKTMTVGGTFTFMAVLGLISGLMLYIPLKYGLKWTAEREAKEKQIIKETQ